MVQGLGQGGSGTGARRSLISRAGVTRRGGFNGTLEADGSDTEEGARFFDDDDVLLSEMREDAERRAHLHSAGGLRVTREEAGRVGWGHLCRVGSMRGGGEDADWRAHLHSAGGLGGTVPSRNDAVRVREGAFEDAGRAAMSAQWLSIWKPSCPVSLSLVWPMGNGSCRAFRLSAVPCAPPRRLTWSGPRQRQPHRLKCTLSVARTAIALPAPTTAPPISYTVLPTST